jgi:hypothetical protein
MSSVRVVASYRVEYYVGIYSVFVVDLIVNFGFFVNVEFSNVFNILPLVVMCKVFMMALMGCMEW